MNSPAHSSISSPSGGVGTPLKYKCGSCPQAFMFKFELASHERKDHLNPEEDEAMVMDEQDKTTSESVEPQAISNSDLQISIKNEIVQNSNNYEENDESNSSSTKSRLKTLRRTNDRRSRDACQTNYNSDGKAEESSKSESETNAATIKNIKRERSYSIQDENVQSDLVITSVSSISSVSSTNISSSNKSNDHDENSNDSQRPSLRLRPRPSPLLSSSSSSVSSPSVPPHHKETEERLNLNSSVQSKSSHLRESNNYSQTTTPIPTKTMTTVMKKTTPPTKTTSRKSTSKLSSIHSCPVCPKAFSTFWNMKRHLKNNHPARTSILLRPEIITSTSTATSTSTSKPTGIVTRARDEEKPTVFPCSICSATFNKKSNRDVHVKIHMGQKFKCAICQSEFSRPSTLIDHIKARHVYKPPPATRTTTTTTTIKNQQKNIKTMSSFRPVSQQQTFKMIGDRYLCQYSSCKITFSRKDAMLEHVKLIHLQVRRFTCPYTNCKRKFGRKDQLNSHMVSHLSSQHPLFKCDVCGKECKSDHYLKYHKKVHSKKVKSIVCPTPGCRRRFFTQSDVNKHSKFAHAPKISTALFHTVRTN